MVIIENYPLAVLFCVFAMICWGSWQNARNLITDSTWRFELFYWDFVFGIVLWSAIGGITLGSFGMGGRSFINDIAQADFVNILSACLGGVVWNLGTLLLVAGITLTGMSVAFPIGGGIGWVLGILINYLANPVGNPTLLLLGAASIVVAILLSMSAYRKLQEASGQKSILGIVLALLAGFALAFFYRFVAAALISDYANPELGKITPYTGVFFMANGAFVSTIAFNTILMFKPFTGTPVHPKLYFKASLKTHALGWLGGSVWCMGTLFSFMASGQAGFAISYGLSNSAPIIAALWGIFVWKEFANAPSGTTKVLVWMFVSYFIGLAFIIGARLL